MCAACRFEVAVRADFAKEISAAIDTDALIRNALALQPKQRKRSPVYARAAVVAAVCLVGAVATASPLGQQAVAVVTQAIRNAFRTPAEPTVNMPVAPPERAPGSTQVREQPPMPEPKPEQTQPVKKASVVVLAKNPTVAEDENPAPVPEAVQEAVPVTIPATASELLTEAIAARRENRSNDARAAYSTLINQYPASPEAVLSFVALGRLELDAAQAQAALELFDRYLASPGPLEEEALAGKARALMLLSRSADESAAWQRLLERFPSSIHEQRARQRLTELGEP
jgi:tetratricopeptide (TPR) repeat protein